MKETRLTLLTVVALTSAFADNCFAAAAQPGLEGIERSIVAEPEYQCSRPLYGLYVLDDAEKTRIWAIVDKTTADNSVYDVLYFDRDGDGDLTDDGERFESGSGKFEIGDFVDPHSGDKHTQLVLSYSSRGSVMLSLNWKGKHKVRGGYAEVPGPYTMFAGSAAGAPVVKMVGEGAFAFQTWMAPETLKIGGSGSRNDIKFFLGHAGAGANTFSAVMHPFLPGDVALEATLVYESTSGAVAEISTRLNDRC